MRPQRSLRLGLVFAAVVSAAMSVTAACGLDPVPETAGDGTDGATTLGGSDTATDAETNADSGTDDSTDNDTGDSTDNGTAPAGPDAAPDPSTFGPYPVGVQTFTIEDASRGEDGPRSLVVEVWYPSTDDTIGMPTVSYGPEDILRPDAIAALGMSVDVSLETTAVRDVPVRSDAGPFPVVMFSHGSGGIRMQSTFFTVALASHGYVVVAPDHIGNTLSDIIIDGDLTAETLLESLGDRTRDLDFIVEHLKDGGEAALASAIDFDRLGVAGHSFGALTSLRWVGLNSDVDAAVAQATPGYSIVWLGIPDPLSDFEVPIMLQVGGLDMTTPPEDAATVWAQMSAPRSQMTLGKAGHFSFSDICSIDATAILASLDLGLSDALDDGCTAENTDRETGAAAMNNFAIGHFNVHLRGSELTRDFLTEAVGRSIVGDELTYVEDR